MLTIQNKESLNANNKLLEEKRIEMIEKGMEEGFQSKNVITISKELDKLIYIQMTNKY